MDQQQIVRDCALAERLERGLADYHSRRAQGIAQPDLLAPQERSSIDSQLGQRLESARLFVRSLPPRRISG